MKIILLLLSAALLSNCATTSSNVKAPLNMPCFDRSQLTSQMTPVELNGSLITCAKRGEWESAVMVFALAGVYGRFDTLRVEDMSAHQAVTVLRRFAFESLSNETQSSLRKTIGEQLGNIEQRKVVCQEIERIGAPDYFPRYMIAHGMRAMTSPSSQDGIVKDFDAKLAWSRSLDGYLHCPAK